MSKTTPAGPLDAASGATRVVTAHPVACRDTGVAACAELRGDGCAQRRCSACGGAAQWRAHARPRMPSPRSSPLARFYNQMPAALRRVASDRRARAPPTCRSGAAAAPTRAARPPSRRRFSCARGASASAHTGQRVHQVRRVRRRLRHAALLPQRFRLLGAHRLHPQLRPGQATQAAAQPAAPRRRAQGAPPPPPPLPPTGQPR